MFSKKKNHHGEADRLDKRNKYPFSHVPLVAFALLAAQLLVSSANAFGPAYSFHRPPAPAVAKGYNRLVFMDDFNNINTLDMADSGAEGFNWYRRLGNWPNSFIGGTPQDASNFSMNGSVLTIATTQGANGLTMMSAAYTAGAPNFVGQVIDPANGFYLEVRMAFDPALADPNETPLGWPCIWMVSLDTLISDVQPFVELNFFEAGPSGVGTVVRQFATHQWQSPGVQVQYAPDDPLGGADLRDMHTYGTRLTPMAANGGTGLIERYFDGVLVSAVTLSYTATTGSTPAATPSNPNGVFSSIEAHRFPIMMGTGVGWPLTIDWIAVWTP